MIIDNSMSFDEIQAYINTSADKIFTFKAGNYVWDQTLKITRSDVTLNRESSTAAVNIVTSVKGNGIDIRRANADSDIKPKLMADFKPTDLGGPNGDQNFIIVDSIGSGSVANKFVYVGNQRDGEDFRREILFVADRSEEVDGKHKIYIKKVVSQSTDPNKDLVKFQNLENEIPMSASGRAASVQIYEPLRNVTIDGINIEYSRKEEIDASGKSTFTPDPMDFSEKAENTGAATIYARGTYNLEIKNLTVKDSLSSGISIVNSIGAKGNNITINGAYDKSEGGNGYGLSFNGSNANLFNNMTIMNMRHAVLFSEYGSENFNYIGVKKTNNDINFHGGLDWDNTINVESSVIDDDFHWPGEEYYDRGPNDGQPDQNRAAYESRNHVTFYSFKGSDEADNVRAHRDGGTLDGAGGNDALYGAAGDDTLEGGTGSDRMFGEKGDDIYGVDNSADQVTERVGEGYDRVYTTASFTLAAGQEVELLHILSATGTAALNLNGNEFDQALVGNAGNNTLDGRGGADTMTGGAGNDIYGVDSAADQVIERSGGGNDRVYTTASYTLAAGQEIELLHILGATGTAALNITGNEFGQALVGNTGNNILDGRGGADTLTGSGGRDTFVFSTALGTSNVDRIEDFVTDVDTIRLGSNVFSGLSAGNLAADRFKDISTGTLDANDRILYKSGTGELFYDADGSGSAAATRFAILDGNPTVKYSDFEIA